MKQASEQQGLCWELFTRPSVLLPMLQAEMELEQCSRTETIDLRTGHGSRCLQSWAGLRPALGRYHLRRCWNLVVNTRGLLASIHGPLPPACS
jgi:hypothetical protein